MHYAVTPAPEAVSLTGLTASTQDLHRKSMLQRYGFLWGDARAVPIVRPASGPVRNQTTMTPIRASRERRSGEVTRTNFLCCNCPLT
jgi:hypothetical protein